MTMTTTLRRRRVRRDSGPSYSELHVSQHAPAVAEALGRTVATAGKYLATNEHAKIVAALIRVAIEAGDRALLQRVMGPIDHALARVEPLPLTPELIHADQVNDLAEDQAEAEHHLRKTPATMRAWLDRRLAARASQRTLDAALAEACAR